MFRIMLVDDEENILKALRRLLSATPCIYDGIEYKLKVDIFTSPQAALEHAAFNPVDLVLSDYRMPNMDGVAFLKAFREIQPDAARLILSGYADLNALVGAINEAQIYRFLNKPWNDYELVSSIAQALAYRNLMRENQQIVDQARVEPGVMSAEELEKRKLEAQEPGITRVNWGPDGSVILDDTELSDVTNPSILSGLLKDFPDRQLDEALAQFLGADRYNLLLEELEARIKERTRLIEAENRQIHQAEKLASVGRLSAGVAHEINNPIGYVRSNLSTALAYLKKFAALGELARSGQPADRLWRELDMDFVLEDFGSLMQESLVGIDRVARIVADLKGFSNIDHGEEEMADLNDSLNQACRTMAAKLPNNIKLNQNLGTIPRILCLPGYLHQVFLNLMENSAQSMSSGGEICVRSQLQDNEINISISDNGHGIPAEVLPRIFEPFFTTRDVGQGTGLGLTVARDIVQVHGGHIEIESREGSGTTVTIYLPV